jgi:hydroxysqualene dehydroxylase
VTLDNGNHLVLSGNQSTFDYLRLVGSADRLAGPDEARLDFCELPAAKRWTLRPNRGPLAWWIFDRSRRVPGTSALDYLALARLLGSHGERQIDEVITGVGPLWDRLIEPFLLAALNTEAKSGSADLAGAVIAQSLARGGNAYRPRVAHPTLSAAFVDPTLAWLADHGATVRMGAPVRELVFEEDRVTALRVGDETLAVEANEAVIIATPPWISTALVPDLTAPDQFNAIVNGHFKITPPIGLAPIVGVIGGTAQWVFAFPDRISVTVSAANALVDTDREALARAFWADIATVHGLPVEIAPWRIVKERRATFAATPEQNAKRPPSKTRWRNLALAGDWTSTGLPATIEGAIRSGKTAAGVIG